MAEREHWVQTHWEMGAVERLEAQVERLAEAMEEYVALRRKRFQVDLGGGAPRGRRLSV